MVERLEQLKEWDIAATKTLVEIKCEEMSLMIRQVLSNILDNAIRYYEGTAPIQMEGSITENEYHVAIISQGQGISKADAEKIFECFYRTDPSRTRNTGGSGLGLAISKEIVELHKDEIRFGH
ncbi:ATP-binding protein [Planococcus sp. ISL-110]|uniref:sensor histidine kinase n=1 Tax=Planococcus sp. ISL-110 TaxID=2819167 RepID=UPI00333CC51B